MRIFAVVMVALLMLSPAPALAQDEQDELILPEQAYPQDEGEELMLPPWAEPQNPPALTSPAPPAPPAPASPAPTPSAPQVKPQKPPPVPVEEVNMGVLKRLGSQNNQIRYTAVVACGHLKLRRGVPALTAMLIDGGDPLMRAAAAWALGRIKDHSSIPKLKSAAWGDIDPAVRAKAVASLAKMGIINVREGPFWDWEEYKSVRNGRSVGVAVLAGGGGAGLALVILGLLGGNDCSWATLINWGNQQDSQSCDDWQNLSIAGGVIAGLSVVIGMPITIYHSSQLRKLEAAYWSGIMPEPAVNVDKKGARLGLTWRF